MTLYFAGDGRRSPTSAGCVLALGESQGAKLAANAQPETVLPGDVVTISGHPAGRPGNQRRMPG